MIESETVKEKEVVEVQASQVKTSDEVGIMGEVAAIDNSTEIGPVLTSFWNETQNNTLKCEKVNFEETLLETLV